MKRWYVIEGKDGIVRALNTLSGQEGKCLWDGCAHSALDAILRTAEEIPLKRVNVRKELVHRRYVYATEWKRA